MRPREFIAPACLILGLLAGDANAQDGPDSSKVYDDIARFAERRKVTRWLYDAIFVSPPDASPGHSKTPAGATRDPNQRFKGRHIRRINVRVLDPFEGDVDDTAAVRANRLERWGNALHVRTRYRIVRGRLLFKEGDAIDPLRLAETERLLRSTAMVSDARVRAVAVKGAADSVDVSVVVQDRWSLDAELGGDPRSVNLTVTERNLMGLGQELSQSFYYDANAERSSWSGGHRVYSIGNSYVSSSLQYALEPAQDRIALSLDRAFYSPLARWAGNLTVGHGRLRGPLDPLVDEGPLVTLADQSDVDAWLGWNVAPRQSKRPLSGTAERVIGMRYADLWYDQRVSGAQWDSAYAGSRLWLASFSMGSRRYAKDSYLYRFARTEDVVEGILWTATTGLSWPTRGRALPYAGGEFTRAGYLGLGDHLSVRVGAGGMIERGSFRDGAAFIDIGFFSRSFPVGRWRFRQFFSCIVGRILAPTRSTPVTIGSDDLIGFSRSAWAGTSKFLLRTETVAYMPGGFLGFRFAPVLSLGVGSVAAIGDRPLEGILQPAIGIGVLIRNERLLIRSFEVSIAYYPPIFPDVDPWQWDPLHGLSLRTPDLAPTRPDMVVIP